MSNNNNNGGGIISLIALLFVAYIIIYIVGLILSVVVPILLTICLLVALFFSLKNYIVSIKDVISNRKVANKTVSMQLDKFYEEFANEGYFFHDVYTDIFDIVKFAWKNNLSTIKNSKGNGFFDKALDYFNQGGWNIVLGICYSIISLIILTFGSLVSLCLTLMYLVVAFVIMLLFYISFGVVWAVDRMYLNINKVKIRCPNEKETFLIPYYRCSCGCVHKKLTPSKFGTFSRKCVCGNIIPCSVIPVKKGTPIHRHDLDAFCPFCNNQLNGTMSRPLGVAIVGGKSTGKTTFKTSFLYSVMEKNLVNAKPVFYDSTSKNEYNIIKQFYENGQNLVATDRENIKTKASAKDIAFFLSNPKFKVSRLIHIYDIDGESFYENTENELQKHLTYSEGLVFCIDPLSSSDILRNCVDVSLEDRKLKSSHDIDIAMNVLLQKLESLNGSKNSNGMFKIPIAIVINKCDSSKYIDNLIGDNACSTFASSNSINYYDAMDYLCRKFLISHGFGNLVQIIDNNFSIKRFFSCVAKGKDINESKYSPKNVTPIMGWLLTRSDKELKSIWNENAVNEITDNPKVLQGVGED